MPHKAKIAGLVGGLAASMGAFAAIYHYSGNGSGSRFLDDEIDWVARFVSNEAEPFDP